ncbi:MAG: hypothetical protein ACYCW6_25415 [Candidatus Xenobia bacterium]
MAWEDVISLRDRLQALLDGIRSSRGIQSPVIKCPHCGHRGPAAAPKVSVRAVLLALKRFDIESDEIVRKLEKNWARQRAEHGLDLYGKVAGQQQDTDHHH